MKKIIIQNMDGVIEEASYINAFDIDNKKIVIFYKGEQIKEGMSKVYVSTLNADDLIGIAEEETWDKIKTIMKSIVQGETVDNCLDLPIENKTYRTVGNLKVIGLLNEQLEKISNVQATAPIVEEKKEYEIPSIEVIETQAGEDKAIETPVIPEVKEETPVITPEESVEVTNLPKEEEKVINVFDSPFEEKMGNVFENPAQKSEEVKPIEIPAVEEPVKEEITPIVSEEPVTLEVPVVEPVKEVIPEVKVETPEVKEEVKFNKTPIEKLLEAAKEVALENSELKDKVKELESELANLKTNSLENEGLKLKLDQVA